MGAVEGGAVAAAEADSTKNKAVATEAVKTVEMAIEESTKFVFLLKVLHYSESALGSNRARFAIAQDIGQPSESVFPNRSGRFHLRESPGGYLSEDCLRNDFRIRVSAYE